MALPKRQTSLVWLTVIAALIFVWQLIELFTHDIAAAPPKLTAPSAPVAAVTTTFTSPNQDNVTNATEDRDFQALLRRYELAKLQHRLADEELAIAKAQQSIRELNHPSGSTNPSDHTPRWQLKYLGRHQEHWSATVARGDELVNIYAGMKLTDHLYVMRINSQGVWLRSPHRLYQLTFAGLSVITEYQPISLNIPAIATPTAKLDPPATNPITPLLAATPATPSTSTPPHVATFDETVLLAMPPHSFTIELATHQDAKELIHLMKKNRIKSRSFIYSHPCQADTCYSLVYGDFLTKSAAEAAQATLAAKLSELKPNIVAIDTIQQVIHQHTKAPN